MRGAATFFSFTIFVKNVVVLYMHVQSEAMTGVFIVAVMGIWFGGGLETASQYGVWGFATRTFF